MEDWIQVIPTCTKLPWTSEDLKVLRYVKGPDNYGPDGTPVIVCLAVDTVPEGLLDAAFTACLSAGAVYICTEDSFPIRRLRQLIREQSCLNSDVPPSLISRLQFSDHIYIEHAADLVSVSC